MKKVEYRFSWSVYSVFRAFVGRGLMVFSPYFSLTLAVRLFKGRDGVADEVPFLQFGHGTLIKVLMAAGVTFYRKHNLPGQGRWHHIRISFPGLMTPKILWEMGHNNFYDETSVLFGLCMRLWPRWLRFWMLFAMWWQAQGTISSRKEAEDKIKTIFFKLKLTKL